MTQRNLYYDMSGGVVESTNKTMIPDNALMGASNVNLDEEGAAQPRGGTTQYGDNLGSTTGTMGLQTYEKYSTGAVTDLMVYNTDIYKYVTGTWTSLSQTLTANKKMVFVNAFDNVYWCNGTDNVAQWDGSTVTPLASNPKGTMLEFHENRILTSGVNGQDDLIYYSDSGATTHTAGNTIALEEKVTGTKPTGDYFFMFTDEGVYRFRNFTYISGTTVGPDKVERLPLKAGCISPRSVAKGNEWLYFVQTTGVWRIRLIDLKLQYISDNSETTFGLLSQANLKDASGAFYKNKYYLTANLTAGGYKTLVYDSIHLVANSARNDFIPAFLPYNNLNALSLHILKDANSTEKLYLADASEGLAMEMETSDHRDDNSAGTPTAVNSFIEKPILQNSPDFRQRWQKQYLDFDPSGDWEVAVGFKKAVSDSYTEQNYNVSGGGKYFKVNLRGNKFFMRVNFTCPANADRFWKLYGSGSKSRIIRRYTP